MAYPNHNAAVGEGKNEAPRTIMQHDTGSFPTEKLR